MNIPFSNIKDFCKKNQIAVFMILLYFSMVGIAVFLRYCDPLFSRDSILYLCTMEMWNQHGTPEIILAQDPDWKTPLFPLFLMKLLVPLGFSTATSALIVNICASAMLPLFMFGIARELTKKIQIAVTAALLTAFHPTILHTAVQAQRDALYLAFLGGFLLLLFRALLRQKYALWGCAGAIFALGILTRYETMELLPLPLLILGWQTYTKKCTLRYFATSSGIFFCGMTASGILAMILSDTLEITWKIYWTRFLFSL